MNFLALVCQLKFKNMKLLVSGCSYSYGYGLPDTINNPDVWANKLASRLNASLTNVSVPGYDNTGIFLNALSEFTSNHYDLILIQLTSLNRIVLSPNIHSKINLCSTILEYDFFKHMFTPTEYKNFVVMFMKLNQDFEHWVRFINILKSIQNLVDRGHNIKLIDGLLDLPKNFINTDRNIWVDKIIDADMLPDEDIAKGVDILNQGKKLIDLGLWINPYNSMKKLQIDNASTVDIHPGIKSQALYADLVYDYITRESCI